LSILWEATLIIMTFKNSLNRPKCPICHKLMWDSIIGTIWICWNCEFEYLKGEENKEEDNEK